jgi:hypothetical protein
MHAATAAEGRIPENHRVWTNDAILSDLRIAVDERKRPNGDMTAEDGARIDNRSWMNVHWC